MEIGDQELEEQSFLKGLSIQEDKFDIGQEREPTTEMQKEQNHSCYLPLEVVSLPSLRIYTKNPLELVEVKIQGTIHLEIPTVGNVNLHLELQVPKNHFKALDRFQHKEILDEILNNQKAKNPNSARTTSKASSKPPTMYDLVKSDI